MTDLLISYREYKIRQFSKKILKKLKIQLRLRINRFPKTKHRSKWCLWICNNKKACIIKILIRRETITKALGKLGWKQLKNFPLKDQWD